MKPSFAKNFDTKVPGEDAAKLRSKDLSYAPRKMGFGTPSPKWLELGCAAMMVVGVAGWWSSKHSQSAPKMAAKIEVEDTPLFDLKPMSYPIAKPSVAPLQISRAIEEELAFRASKAQVIPLTEITVGKRVEAKEPDAIAEEVFYSGNVETMSVLQEVRVSAHGESTTESPQGKITFFGGTAKDLNPGQGEDKPVVKARSPASCVACGEHKAGLGR